MSESFVVAAIKWLLFVETREELDQRGARPSDKKLTWVEASVECLFLVSLG